MPKLLRTGLDNLNDLARGKQSITGNSKLLDKKLKTSLICAVNKDASEETVHMLLSGGIDSSLIAGILGLELKKKIVAYTVCDVDSPDLKFAGIMVNFLKERGVNIAWVKKPLSIEEQQVDFVALEKSLKIDAKRLRGNRKSWPVLFKNLQNIIGLKNNFFKLITGDGGDELFGYPVVQDPDLILKEPKYLLIASKNNLEEQLIKGMKSGDRYAALRYYRVIARDSLFGPEEKYARFFGFKLHTPYLHKRVVNTVLQYNFSDIANNSGIKLPLKRIAFEFVPEEIINRKKLGLGKSIRPQWEDL